MTEVFGRIISNIRSGSSAAHSYIVEVQPGEGRAAVIKEMCTAILCEHPLADGSACGSCPSCRQIAAGSCLDVIRMERSGKTAYVVEDASSFMSRIGMGAYGKRIIGVIEDAEMLSDTVQNKLLKTLEEPEEGVIILLMVSSADKLLSTVRSRCFKLRAEDCFEDFGDTDGGTVDVESFNSKYFYKCREAVDKKVKSVEDAIALLSALEDLHRDEMVNGRNTEGHARAIELIETARVDIFRGMQYGRALKRLRLELAE